MNNIELENKILELTKRIEKLEKIEKRRKIILIIKIVFYIILIIALCLLIYKMYLYINNNIIKPLNNVSGIFNESNSYIDETTNGLKSLFGN